MKLYSDEELAEILDQPIFHQISEAADRQGVECYVVGGYVRDIFLERPSNDIDVVVVGSGIEVAKELKRMLGRRAHLSVFKNFGTAQVKFREEGGEEREVEFVGARKESYSHDSRKPIVEDGTLEDDQNRRDFTINAMAICLNKNRFGELVDPFNGLADLEDGIIATPLEPGITFSDDPLRMMRCIRFATQLNFRIEDETFEALERMADRIKIVSGERIEVELNKIIMSDHPSKGFVDLQRSGLLNIILPELAALDIVEQKNGRAHKNNFYHTLEVLENVVRSEELRVKSEEFPSGVPKGLGEGMAVANSSLFTLHSSLYLRWAALLHDIGKTKSKRWEPAVGWTFHNHNFIGAKMVPEIFRRLKLPMGAEMKYVQKLVDLHMRPQAIADSEVTDSAVRRLLNDAGDDIDDLMTLCEADITSKNEVKKKMFLENFRMVREKLADLKEKDYKRLLQPVIDGNEIMQLFDLKPSREVGTLKQYLKDAVLDNKVENEREPLMQLLMEKAREMGLKAFCLVAMLVAGVSVWAQKSIVILYENDVHCGIDGYAKMAGLRDAITQADTAYVGAVCVGDFLQGNTTGAISKGQYVIDIMRHMNYDALTLGNHEFDYGVPRMKSLLEQVGAPVVCANFYEAGSPEPYYAPYVIRQYGDKRVAFVGACTPETMILEGYSFYDTNGILLYDLKKDSFYQLIQQAADNARKEGADYVVLLSHVGETTQSMGFDSHRLVNSTKGIDVVLDGHSHNVFEDATASNLDGRPIIVTQTGTQFGRVGKLVITPDGRIVTQLIKSSDIPYKNARVAAVTDSIKGLVKAVTDKKIGHTDYTLVVSDDNDQWIVRSQETNAGDLVADAYRHAMEADIGFENGGGIRNDIMAGDITYGDVIGMLPYDNVLLRIAVSGQQLKAMLERCTASLPELDGNFPQCSGLRYVVHSKSHTVSDIEVLQDDGSYAPLVLNRQYSVALTDYNHKGGGFYDCFKGCPVLFESTVRYYEALANYIHEQLGGTTGAAYLQPQGRIRVVDD